MKRYLILAGALLLAVAIGLVVAHNRPSADEQAVDYRQALMTVIDGQLQPLLEMQHGQRPFDLALVRLHAGNLTTLAHMVPEAFARNTSAAGQLQTGALSFIWQDPRAFRTRLDQFTAVSEQLREAAAAGEPPGVDRAVAALETQCVQCHRSFRSD